MEELNEIINYCLWIRRAEDLARLQRSPPTDPDAPDPSIETILHAHIPYKYVDHTHADAVVTITNNKNGKSLIREMYQERVRS